MSTRRSYHAALLAIACVVVAFVLTACGGGGGGGGAAPADATSDPALALAAAQPKPTAQEASRFLARATYGPIEAEIQSLAQGGYAAWFAAQFAQAPTSALAYLDRERPLYQAKMSDVGMSQMDEAFWTGVTRGSDALRQRAVFALSQIFVISTEGSALGGEPYAIGSFYDMLGRNAFGNFRTLLEEVSLHPAMGRYLSHLANEKESTKTVSGQTVTRVPDENYAREVMQLFTIGLWQLNADGTQQKDGGGNPIPTYGQDEILGMAKVFTGFSWGHCNVSEDACFRGGRNGSTQDPGLQRWRLSMQAFDRFHSTAEKRIVGGKTIAGGGTAQGDLRQALDALFNHPNVGPFIGRQLIQRLVTSNPSPAYVARVAAAFADNGQGVRGDMKVVLQAVLLDPEARDAGKLADPAWGKLREPVAKYGQFLRAFGVKASSGYTRIGDLSNPVSGLGQSPFRSPSVFNFYRPDFAPPGRLLDNGLNAPEFQITHETTVTGNINFADGIVRRSAGSNPDTLVADYSAFLADASAPDRLVDRLNLLLAANALQPATRASVADALKAMADKNDTDKLNRVRTAVFLVMASPDYLIQK